MTPDQMPPEQALAWLQDRGVDLRAHDGRIQALDPHGVLTPQLRGWLRDRRESLLLILSNQPATDQPAAKPQRRDPAGLLDALEVACGDLPITPGFVLSALTREDKADWECGDLPPDTLHGFAKALVWRRAMDQGVAPDHYTKRALCQHCGPIWHWLEGTYLSCPWCRNREAGRPIPQPPVACRKCRYWSADKINPAGGSGSCAVIDPVKLPEGACWPRGEIICAHWRPSPKGDN